MSNFFRLDVVGKSYRCLKAKRGKQAVNITFNFNNLIAPLHLHDLIYY